jgi:N-acetylmuramic acid 6-phosphate (MurNAc-6-P) etherase
MSHVVPASDKLRQRARRIVMSLAGVCAADAARLLEECEGNTAAAIVRAQEREQA